jgi:hypothetical protein
MVQGRFLLVAVQDPVDVTLARRKSDFFTLLLFGIRVPVTLCTYYGLARTGYQINACKRKRGLGLKEVSFFDKHHLCSLFLYQTTHRDATLLDTEVFFNHFNDRCQAIGSTAGVCHEFCIFRL